eukprot:gene12681-13982_t
MSSSSSVSSCVKFSLFFLNILFWIIGLVMTVLGIYAKTLKEMDTVIKSAIAWYMDPTIWIIAIGVLIFFLAFLGCIGSLRENIVMLKIFEYFIDFIMLVEIVLVLCVYFFRAKIKNFAENKLVDVIPKYRDDADLQSIIDWLQINLKCCGIKNYNDWEKNIYFNCSSPGAEACGVPYSCCKGDKLNTQCGYKVRSPSTAAVSRQSKIYTIGCLDAAINAVVKDNLIAAICVGAGIVVLQLIATGLAHSLVNGIKEQMASWNSQPRQVLRGHDCSLALDFTYRTRDQISKLAISIDQVRHFRQEVSVVVSRLQCEPTCAHDPVGNILVARHQSVLNASDISTRLKVFK